MVGAGRAGHDPRVHAAWSPRLIDLAHHEPCRSTPCRALQRRRDDRQPPRGACPPTGPPALEHAPDPPAPDQGSARQLLLRLEQRAPRGVDVQDLRPLRGRPCGPILDLDAYPGAPTSRRRTAREKITYSNTGLTDPAPSGMTCDDVELQGSDTARGMSPIPTCCSRLRGHRRGHGAGRGQAATGGAG